MSITMEILKEESRLCKDGHYRHWVQIKCNRCNKFFWKEKRWTKKSDKTFCSKECLYISKQKRTKVMCSFCGKELIRRLSHIRNNKTNLFFCNNKCSSQAASAKMFCKTKTLQCCKCGKNVEVDSRTSKIKCYSCRHPGFKKKPNDYYKVLTGEENTTSYTCLRAFLIKEGIKENKCEKCSITEWQGKPICIQLHHEDGNRNNNLLENLKMVCPNCHTQTITWGVRNKKLKIKNTVAVA